MTQRLKGLHGVIFGKLKIQECNQLDSRFCTRMYFPMKDVLD